MRRSSLFAERLVGSCSWLDAQRGVWAARHPLRHERAGRRERYRHQKAGPGRYRVLHICTGEGRKPLLRCSFPGEF
jgi:hypothetical protein